MGGSILDAGGQERQRPRLADTCEDVDADLGAIPRWFNGGIEDGPWAQSLAGGISSAGVAGVDAPSIPQRGRSAAGLGGKEAKALILTR